MTVVQTYQSSQSLPIFPRKNDLHFGAAGAVLLLLSTCFTSAPQGTLPALSNVLFSHHKTPSPPFKHRLRSLTKSTSHIRLRCALCARSSVRFRARCRVWVRPGDPAPRWKPWGKPRAELGGRDLRGSARGAVHRAVGAGRGDGHRKLRQVRLLPFILAVPVTRLIVAAAVVQLVG